MVHSLRSTIKTDSEPQRGEAATKTEEEKETGNPLISQIARIYEKEEGEKHSQPQMHPDGHGFHEKEKEDTTG